MYFILIIKYYYIFSLTISVCSAVGITPSQSLANFIALLMGFPPLGVQYLHALLMGSPPLGDGYTPTYLLLLDYPILRCEIVPSSESLLCCWDYPLSEPLKFVPLMG